MFKDFLDLAERRYSVRKYSDKPVEQEKMDRILKAMRAAPTAANRQPQRIFVLESEEARAKAASGDFSGADDFNKSEDSGLSYLTEGMDNNNSND